MYKKGDMIGTVYCPREMTERCDDLEKLCRQQLAGYKRRRSFVDVHEGQASWSGNILKRVLREPYWAGQSRKVIAHVSRDRTY